MNIDCTPAVERALAAAQFLAENEGRIDAQSRHALLGLLQEEEGQAWALLSATGVDPVRARQELAHLTSESRPMDDILTHARHLASTLCADQAVASDQLLLAILELDATLREQLEGMGLDLAKLQEAVNFAAGPPLPLDDPLDLQDTVGHADSLRILDANANRAREALRVLEDYARFALDDAILCRELKSLRHDLAACLSVLPLAALLAHRDTEHDVGTAISTEREMQRESLAEVVTAACKRLQEALRSMEEYGKLHGGDLARGLESMRYRGYTIERALHLGEAARDGLADIRLYVLLGDGLDDDSLERIIRRSATGGAQMFQLRDKGGADLRRLERGRLVRKVTRATGTLFIMNDRPDLARLVEADGVHLGQEDLPVREARRLLGQEALIGVSTHDLDQLRQAVLDGASYVGVGPTFPSSTKVFSELAGLEFVRQAMAETRLPAFALGGITVKNVGEVVAAGARRVAVSAAICQAEDVKAAASTFRAVLAVSRETASDVR